MNGNALLACCLMVVAAYVQGFLAAEDEFLWSLLLVPFVTVGAHIIARETETHD